MFRSDLNFLFKDVWFKPLSHSALGPSWNAPCYAAVVKIIRGHKVMLHNYLDNLLGTKSVWLPFGRMRTETNDPLLACLNIYLPRMGVCPGFKKRGFVGQRRVFSRSGPFTMELALTSQWHAENPSFSPRFSGIGSLKGLSDVRTCCCYPPG